MDRLQAMGGGATGLPPTGGSGKKRNLSTWNSGDWLSLGVGVGGCGGSSLVLSTLPVFLFLVEQLIYTFQTGQGTGEG